MTVLKWYFSAREYSNPRKWSFYRALIWIFEEQDEIQTRSPIATLAKAEILAKKMKNDDSYILENPRSEEFDEVGNIDWRLEMTPKNEYHHGMKVSQMKLKICELATGNKFTEEWTFLPKNCQHTVCKGSIQFYQNFALIGCNRHRDILMLNLATRKQFWVHGDSIINQMKAKAPVGDHELHENPLNIGNDTLIGRGIGKMDVENNKIEVHYSAIMNYGYTVLGGLKCRYIKISISL